jgi:hypothetical protein
MFRHTMTITTLCLLLHPCIACSQSEGSMKVALLPMRQPEASRGAAVSDDALATALLVELTKTREFELIEPVQLDEAFEKTLIDEAIFELLVTDSLTQTLERLDSFCRETGRHDAYAKTATDLGAAYSVEVAIDAGRYQTEVTYRLTDTQTSRVACAESFSTSLAGSRSLARETANRVTRDLWKLKHRGQSAQ